MTNQLKTQHNLRIDGIPVCFKVTPLAGQRMERMGEQVINGQEVGKGETMRQAVIQLSTSLNGPKTFTEAVTFLRDSWGMNRNMAIEIGTHRLWDISTEFSGLDYLLNGASKDD